MRGRAFLFSIIARGDELCSFVGQIEFQIALLDLSQKLYPGENIKHITK